MFSFGCINCFGERHSRRSSRGNGIRGNVSLPNSLCWILSFAIFILTEC